MYPSDKIELAIRVQTLNLIAGTPEGWEALIEILEAVVDALPTTPDPWEE